MKGNVLTLVVTCTAMLSPLPAPGAPAVEAWARRYSNLTESQDQGFKAVTDSAGNVIVAGYTDEGVTGPDILIIKYSGAGAPLWTNRYDGPFHSTDEPHGLAVDGADNVIVTGYSYGGASYFDFVTIKYSSAGVGLWTNLYDGPGSFYDNAAAVAVDGSGNVYVTGTSDGIGTGHDFLTIAYSSAGTGLWTNRYNGPGNGDDEAAAVSVALDGSGNVFVTGYSDSGGFNVDYATIAYSGTGATLWVSRYNGPANSYDYPTALAADQNGNVYVTGYSDDGSFNDDYATVAYTGTGTALWTNRYNGPADNLDEPWALAVVGGTNVYVTGFSYDPVTDYDIATVAYSSTGAGLWTRRYNSAGNGDDEGYALAADASGNLYVTGFSSGVGTDWDYATVAYASDGTVLWATRYNGPASNRDVAYAVAAGNGRIFVTGYASSGASYDMTTLAYSSLGVAVWTNRYNGPGNNDDAAYAVAVDGSGQVYVTGASRGLDSIADWATVAYSSAGVALWTNRFNGSVFNSDDEPRAVAVDGSGKVFVTGYYQNPGGYDYLTIAYASTGAALWTNVYDGPISYGDYAQALALGGGNVYVTGYSQSTNGDDYATIAYSSAGVGLWTNRYDGPAHGTDRASAVAVDASGNVYVTGGSDGIDSNNDFATVAYSSTGVALWTNRYNGPGNNDDVAQAVAVGGGNVYVTGYSYGSDSSEDYATIAYSSAGVALWTNRYNGPGNGTDRAQAVAVDTNGNVCVTGYSRGGGTGDDYATIAYSSAGVALWTNRYNGPGNGEDHALAVAADGSGQVYVTGYAHSGAGSVTADFTTIAYSTAGVALGTNRYDGPFNGVDQPLSSRSLAVGADGSVVVVGRSAGRYFGNAAYDYATVKYITGPPPPPPPGPPLTIIPYGTSVLLVWATNPPGFYLQSTTDLFAPAAWQGGFSPPILLDEYNVVIEPIVGNRKFYRLSQ
jgi:hypothetical protein